MLPDEERPDAQPCAQGASPAMVVCRSCEQWVRGDLPFCPHCCGDDGRRGARTRGAFIGGVFGLLGGGLASAVWSSAMGLEQTTWMPVLLIVLTVMLSGVVAGAIASRKG